jgi:hypothetical protein
MGSAWTQDSADSDREITKEHLDRCTADHEKFMSQTDVSQNTGQIRSDHIYFQIFTRRLEK